MKRPSDKHRQLTDRWLSSRHEVCVLPELETHLELFTARSSVLTAACCAAFILTHHLARFRGSLCRLEPWPPEKRAKLSLCSVRRGIRKRGHRERINLPELELTPRPQRPVGDEECEEVGNHKHHHYSCRCKFEGVMSKVGYGGKRVARQEGRYVQPQRWGAPSQERGFRATFRNAIQRIHCCFSRTYP